MQVLDVVEKLVSTGLMSVGRYVPVDGEATGLGQYVPESVGVVRRRVLSHFESADPSDLFWLCFAVNTESGDEAARHALSTTHPYLDL